MTNIFQNFFYCTATDENKAAKTNTTTSMSLPKYSLKPSLSSSCTIIYNAVLFISRETQKHQNPTKITRIHKKQCTYTYMYV